MQRVLAQHTARQRIMQMGFHGTGAIKGLAKADDPGIRMDADPKHVGKLFRAQRLDCGNLHVAPHGSRAALARSASCRSQRQQAPDRT